MPDGPAATSILSAMLWIHQFDQGQDEVLHVMVSSSTQTANGTGGLADGYFSNKISQTVLETALPVDTAPFVDTRLSRRRMTPPFSWLVIMWRAALTSLSNVDLHGGGSIKLFVSLNWSSWYSKLWMVWPPWRSWLISPSGHIFKQCSSCAMWCPLLSITTATKHSLHPALCCRTAALCQHCQHYYKHCQKY